MTFPEEQPRYLDPEGFGDYRGRDEWEISLEKQVPIRAEAAWNAWLARVWEGQSAPVMIDPVKALAASAVCGPSESLA